MCGRFTQQASWAEVVAFMQPIPLLAAEEAIEPAYNIAPSQPCWALRPGEDALEGARMRWGLLPGWAKEPRIAYSTFNARAETMAEKPAFRSAFRHRRCLVPASGYYEWKAEGKAKQPFYIHDEAAPILLFAALWEAPHPRFGELPSVSIVTREADGPVSALHHRVPLMLDPELGAQWCRGSADDAAGIAHAAPGPQLAWHPVDRRVGNVREQGPGLVKPVRSLL
ncbi:SOS response-associated peptidase [Pseudomarimonas salicorniae]|uniref:Abasic site processing protein n=1 Tax=Pseudomarimonas salicorniae TaxID=2933270 RepID=A0ABT0GK82_9GAMM|nr:SOS response-associated peptidase [Lysobacter sp. CAU 1642]MCK7594956.1 SOS response-associated peptidase [Lysobacter sp. CAU 1642]